MEIQTSNLYLPSTNKQQETLPANAKEENKISQEGLRKEGSQGGLRNQNGEHTANICKSNIIETQVNQPELYFLLKIATNNIKIKLTHRISGD